MNFKTFCFLLLKLLPFIFLSYYFRKIITFDESNVIALLSITTGFQLSAIAIIYASPIREILYTIKSDSGRVIWDELLSKMFNLLTLTTLFCFIILSFCKIEWLYFGIFCFIIIEILKLYILIFKILEVRIKDG